jgi:ketosteroid isomerase-like protein
MEPAPDLRQVISEWFEAAAKGDTSWRDRHVSRQAALRIVGTDPDEWLQGEPAYQFLKNEAETVGGRATVKVLEVEAYRQGDIGWGLALPEITLGSGQQVKPRWSAVFIRENDEWKVIQLHASVGIGNVEAFGDTFSA